MSRQIATIENEPIIEGDDLHVRYHAKAAIDCDGSVGNPWHDPCFQPDTSAHDAQGHALNANEVPYIVVPPAIIKGVRSIVLGAQAYVTNLVTKKCVEAVVGDIGPRAKLGEISVECARRLGIPCSPNSGGDSRHQYAYEIIPGQAAIVDGIVYPLKAS